MGRRILILEDNASRMEVFTETIGERHDIFHADQAAKAIDAMFDAANCKNPFEVIFLDHDLGGMTFVGEADTNTGSEVVRWMVSKKGASLGQPTIIIHSCNHPAAANMSAALIAAGFENVHVISFMKLCDRKYLLNPEFLS